jgi:hypothetical protein
VVVRRTLWVLRVSIIPPMILIHIQVQVQATLISTKDLAMTAKVRQAYQKWSLFPGRGQSPRRHSGWSVEYSIRLYSSEIVNV